jgi:RHS repeat-associated protein
MLARYYEAGVGRFLSPDWSSSPVPVPYADFSDPQTTNLYSYVHNNPVSQRDGDGHCYPFCTVAIGAAVGAIAGGAAEYVSERINHQPTNWTKIEHAAAGGAVTGALTGLLGPEAGAAAKVGSAIGASVAGGATDRKLEGGKVLDGKAIATDAVLGVASAGIEAGAAKLIGAPSILKVTDQSAAKTTYGVKSASEVAAETTERNVVRKVGEAVVETATETVKRSTDEKK